MQNTRNNRGVSIIAAIFIIVILAFMGAMFLSLINTGSFTSVNDLQSTQALYVAQGGIEYILNYGTFPNFSMGLASKSLGAGNFTVTAPATLNMPPGGITSTNGTGAITVYAAPLTNFSAGGGLIDIDSEIIAYTSWNGTQFTGITRAQRGTAGATHANGNAVYPATYLTSRINNATCSTNYTVNVSNTGGFLIPGIISIGTELIYCTGAGAGSFTGCNRCYLGSAGATHANGSTVNQFIINSTGIVGSAQRMIKVGVSNIANAAVRYDARSNPTGFVNQSTFQWAHTVNGARANRMLIVGVSLYDASQQITSVTYNSLPLSLLNARSGTNVRVEQWGLVEPPGGTYQVAVTLSGTTQLAAAGAISLYNVDQVNPVDVAPIDNIGNNNAPSLTSTTSTRNAMVIDTLAAIGTATFTNVVSCAQTSEWNTIVNNGATYLRSAGSYKAAGAGAPPVNVTTCWTLSGTPNWAYSAVTIRPQGLFVLDWREQVN